MILPALLFAILAFALFAGSTDDHHQKRLGGRPSRTRKRRFRIGAWIALIVCFGFAIAARGWIYGPVTWFALVMLGAGAVFLTLNFTPSKRDRT